MMRKMVWLSALMLALSLLATAQNAPNPTATTAAAAPPPASDVYEYKLLATNKTSTMEKEMNEAAQTGFRFERTMGGETTAGGSEITVIMSRHSSTKNDFEYRLLATSKTSTMQKELNDAGAQGFRYVGQTIYSTTFGGREVVVILERRPTQANITYFYKLQATKLTSTLQKELNTVGQTGYALCGLTVAETLLGGKEIVAILCKSNEKF